MCLDAANAAAAAVVDAKAFNQNVLELNGISLDPTYVLLFRFYGFYRSERRRKKEGNETEKKIAFHSIYVTWLGQCFT